MCDYGFRMNEWNKLNSELILAWMEETGRKRAYVERITGKSRWTVAKMLNEGHIPDDMGAIKSLAAEMGVDERQLILPRESESQTA